MAFPDAMKIAIRQTTRWLYAAKQDKSPLVAMLHANYAVGNIDLMRQMWTDAEIAAGTGYDIHALVKDAQQVQDAAQRRLGLS